MVDFNYIIIKNYKEKNGIDYRSSCLVALPPGALHDGEKVSFKKEGQCVNGMVMQRRY